MLGIPFTSDLIALGTNSAISDALIEKAVSAGKTEAQINAAMASLWGISVKIQLFKNFAKNFNLKPSMYFYYVNVVKI